MRNQSKKFRSSLAIGTGVLLAAMLSGQASGQAEYQSLDAFFDAGNSLDDYLLPDMMPWISGSPRYTHGWRINGSLTEFSATTTPLNLGAGHLEVTNAIESPDGNTTAVYQTLYHNSYDDLNQGAYDHSLSASIQVGDFVNHHGHFHFEGYAQMVLHEVTEGRGIGDVAATGEKISFCMIDLDEFDSTTNTPGRDYSNCGNGIQGISAGHGDIYSSGLDGQQIDLTGLARTGSFFNGGATLVEDNTNGDSVDLSTGGGLYWLQVTVDVDNAMIESNNYNNTAYVLIDLNDEGQQIDDHASNGNEDQATWLNNAEYRFGEINWENDTDVFSIDVVEGALYNVYYEETQTEYTDITVTDSDGDQAFYESLGAQYQQSSSFEFRADGDGKYHVEIGETQANFGSGYGAYLVRYDLIAIAGDANLDDEVNIEDLDMILATWGDTVVARTAGDFNGDGVIGQADLDILNANWGATLADYGVSVPEPGSIALLGLGGLALLRRRR